MDCAQNFPASDWLIGFWKRHSWLDEFWTISRFHEIKIKFIWRLTKKRISSTDLDIKHWSWFQALIMISSIDLDIKHWSWYQAILKSWNPKYKSFQLRVSTHLLSVLLNDLSSALIVTGQHTAKHNKIGASTKRLKIPFSFLDKSRNTTTKTTKNWGNLIWMTRQIIRFEINISNFFLF